MRVASAIVAALLASLAAGESQAQPANARNWFWRYNDLPWCTMTSGVPECDYATLQQCLMARSGVGGSCSPNPRLSYNSQESDQLQPPPRRRPRPVYR